MSCPEKLPNGHKANQTKAMIAFLIMFTITTFALCWLIGQWMQFAIEMTHGTTP